MYRISGRLVTGCANRTTNHSKNTERCQSIKVVGNDANNNDSFRIGKQKKTIPTHVMHTNKPINSIAYKVSGLQVHPTYQELELFDTEDNPTEIYTAYKKSTKKAIQTTGWNKTTEGWCSESGIKKSQLNKMMKTTNQLRNKNWRDDSKTKTMRIKSSHRRGMTVISSAMVSEKEKKKRNKEWLFEGRLKFSTRKLKHPETILPTHCLK